MTVSLAMRDSPKISGPTKTRVRQYAAELGYRPDPEVARLMGRLRASRLARRSVVIAVLDLGKDSTLPVHPYGVRLRTGIARHAERLGFGLTTFRLCDYHGDGRKLMAVIRSRGITGLIILPADEPVVFDPGIDWSGFAVVAATTSVLAPRLHRVVPHQIYNSMSLVAEMGRRGYTRIGAILSQSFEARTAHYHSLVLAWHGHRERILLLPDSTSAAANEKRIAAWIREHEVDVILAQDAALVYRALRSAGLKRRAKNIGLVSLSTIENQGIAFQDELPEYIGETAVSLLAGMMHHNETGLPEHPRITTVDGVFRSAPSVRPVLSGAG
jgi:LacI family transcriptional regulator